MDFSHWVKKMSCSKYPFMSHMFISLVVSRGPSGVCHRAVRLEQELLKGNLLLLSKGDSENLWFFP